MDERARCGCCPVRRCLREVDYEIWPTPTVEEMETTSNRWSSCDAIVYARVELIVGGCQTVRPVIDKAQVEGK